jgi:hypothetical protein
LRQGSSRKTWLAAVRLMPTAPERTLSRNTAGPAAAAAAAAAAVRIAKAVRQVDAHST